MSSWRDYARKVEEPVGPCANSAISANSPVEAAQAASNGTIGTNGTLPDAIIRGLAALAKSPAPRVRCPEIWPQVMADAARLASEGWAANALSLGWSLLDLFGAVTDPEGDPDADGLAVKLSGRRLLAICKGFATVAELKGGRSYLYRGDTRGAQLLWELGRVNHDT